MRKPARKLKVQETVGSIRCRTGKKVYRVVLSEVIYVIAKGPRSCDNIVCKSRSRWARYESAEEIKDPKQQIYYSSVIE